jgi:hypothetical protein
VAERPSQGFLIFLAYAAALALCLAFWWFLPQIAIWTWKEITQ